MIFDNLSIPAEVIDFFNFNKSKLCDLESINDLIKKKSGIIDFFTTDEELFDIRNLIDESGFVIREPGKREYGDFQTNDKLAQKCLRLIYQKNKNFDFLLEPTCGKGAFILAALSLFPDIRNIVGIDIYQPYIRETKIKILQYFLINKKQNRPRIKIIHKNVFDFDFKALAENTKSNDVLIIGNPPWVTNSELSSINSRNLPQKSNFKNFKGIDAITGKANFDIAEYITLLILKNFSKHQGIFGFLLKNSVIKNIIHDQKQNQFSINSIERYNIDSKKEFNVSVEASLFVTNLSKKPGFSCKEFDLYSCNFNTEFGWDKNHYVYSISDYKKVDDIEGISSFVWRQGLKHDCSKVMEIESFENNYRNGLDEKIELEDDLLFPLLKSSDLKDLETQKYRKLTIVTQNRIGEETSYIKIKHPKTYGYLYSHKEYFERRKSSIYKGKPPFSIFGIGDYSFYPYKIAISGMYKSTHFTLVKPINNKPCMLDDTCYFIGFDDYDIARTAHFFLNHSHTQSYLKSIIFPDSKRPITKELLMRLDFVKMYDLIDYSSDLKNIDWLDNLIWEKFDDLIRGEEIFHGQLALL